MQYRQYIRNNKYSKGGHKPHYSTMIASTPKVKLAHMLSQMETATWGTSSVSREQPETNQKTELNEWERE